MRSVLAAAAAALALTMAAASAQAPTPVPPSRCPEFPQAPTLPDGGATRNFNVMNRANDTYNEWSQQTQSALTQCRQGEVRELRAKADAAHAQLEARVNEFNATFAVLKQTCRSWIGELNEFHQREGNRDQIQDPAVCEGGDAAAQKNTPRNRR